MKKLPEKAPRMSPEERRQFLSRSSLQGRLQSAMQHLYQHAFDSLAPEMESDADYPFLLNQRSADLLRYAARSVLASPFPA